MRKYLLLLLIILSGLPLFSQTERSMRPGCIVLNPYLRQGEAPGEKTSTAIIAKLNQIATFNGTAGEGFDNRFVITAHLQELDYSMTETYPQKAAVKLSISVYIGDGLNGTLFASATKEVKGIGDTKDDAYTSAVKKLRPNDPELQAAVNKGKRSILDYYNQIGRNILNKAASSAASADYDEAITMLMTIPQGCKDYDAAQKLIAKYGAKSLDLSNQAILAQAKAAWSASPNEDGAAKAEDILTNLNAPSAVVAQGAKALMQEMASRLKAVKDRELQNERYIQLAKINADKAAYKAAAQVATAYYKSLPRVTYNILWW